MSSDPKTTREPTPLPSPSPRPSTQVIVAVLGLTGVLGAALIANWDKLFGGRHGAAVSPAASVVAAASAPASLPPTPRSGTTGDQSPIVNSGGGSVTINIAPATPAASVATTTNIASLLVGTWITPLAQNPYSRDHPFRLRLRFERFGDQLIGTATDIRADAAGGHVLDMVDLKVDGQTASFHTTSTTLGSGGSHVPYQTTYRLELDGPALRITRRNNVSTGGAIERFDARRDPAADDTGKVLRP